MSDIHHSSFSKSSRLVQSGMVLEPYQPDLRDLASSLDQRYPSPAFATAAELAGMLIVTPMPNGLAPLLANHPFGSSIGTSDMSFAEEAEDQDADLRESIDALLQLSEEYVDN